MKNYILTLILICGSIFFAQSQPILGKYFIQTSNGEINFSLQNASGGKLGGTLTLDNGTQYTLQGEGEEGEAYGLISAPNGSKMYFECYLEGSQLSLTIAPIVNENVDYNQMQQFLLNKKGTVNSPSVQMQQNPSRTQVNPMQSMINKSGQNSIDQFSGTYQGNINGTPSTLQLNTNASALSGVIDAGGYKYSIQGSFSDDKATGTLVDDQTQGQMKFTATSNNGIIDFSIQAQDMNTGQMTSFNLSFSKGGQMQSANRYSQNSGSSSANVPKDMNLVGLWTYSDSYTSGEYSFASQFQMQVNQDGTYLYGNGKVAGGGGGVSGTSGGGDVTRGQWKTENGVIYTNEGQGWVAYAGYYVEGNKLLLKFNDGSRQIWYR